VNALMTMGLAAGLGSLGLTGAPPPTAAPAPAAPAVRLAADTVPLGAIPAAFLRNQLTFCGLICPSIVQLVTTVPVGAAEAPLNFVGALPSGSLLEAIGAAAESVTAPADAAVTGIITPDVFIVVPKAVGNTLQVSVVQAIHVGEAVLTPGQLLPAIETARSTILAALDTPATDPPSPIPTGARGPLDNVAVAAVSIPVAVAFQAGELLLQGATHTANATATTLADTGDVAKSLAAGGAAARANLQQAGGIVTDAVHTAVTNIRNSLPKQRAAKPSTHQAATPGAHPVKAAVKGVARAVHQVAKPHRPRHQKG
jgi:hypothetical protein